MVTIFAKFDRLTVQEENSNYRFFPLPRTILRPWMLGEAQTGLACFIRLSTLIFLSLDTSQWAFWDPAFILQLRLMILALALPVHAEVQTFGGICFQPWLATLVFISSHHFEGSFLHTSIYICFVGLLCYVILTDYFISFVFFFSLFC